VLAGRGKGALALGAGLYVVAWGFGTSELFAAALGLMLLPAAAWLWVRFMARPMTMRRRTAHRELIEGGRVEVLLEVRSDEGPLPSRAVVVERVFVIPGLGSLLLDGVSNRDLLLVQDVVMLLVVAVLVVNFLVDLLYVALDPRLRVGQR